jgi:hypothetical protein
VHELVIVVSDLYLPQESLERQLPPGVALPGLQHAARFGTRSKIAGGWRPWLARWLIADRQGRRAAAASAGALGSADDSWLLGAAPATVAAAALARRRMATQPQGSTEAQSQGPPATRPPSAAMPSPASAVPNPQQPATVWMATPVHLVAGLTSVHLDRRSLLRLSADDLTALATEFERVFHDSGFVLEPLDSGDFLLFAPQMRIAQTSEPALLMGNSIADAQSVGAGDPALRRFGAEVEMWLHEHPVNDARRRRGEAPVTGLWLWGGGLSPSPRAAQTTGAASSDIAFGRDAYLEGLWTSMGKKVFPLPQQLSDVFGYPQVRRAAVVIEIGLMLHSNPRWTFFDAVAQIDRAFIAPAVEALRAAKFARLVILANDRELALRARDRFKLWRQIPPGLSGLQ